MGGWGDKEGETEARAEGGREIGRKKEVGR